MKQIINPIDIIYDHHDFILVNKPAGLDVHNKPGNLLDLLEANTQLRFHAVHRLDQDTSGILVLAKTAKVTTTLQASLQSSQSQKSYLAIVKGQPNPSQGQWSMPISAKAEGRRDPAGLAKHRIEACTQYMVIEQTPWLSLLKCRLLTGRQHQIRKHCALARCPIVGDLRYGDPKHARLMTHKFKFKHLALHACSISFNYLGQEYSFSQKPPLAWSNFDFTYPSQL